MRTILGPTCSQVLHTFAEVFERANRIAVFCNLRRASLNNIKTASKVVVTHEFEGTRLQSCMVLSCDASSHEYATLSVFYGIVSSHDYATLSVLSN